MLVVWRAFWAHSVVYCIVVGVPWLYCRVGAQTTYLMRIPGNKKYTSYSFSALPFCPDYVKILSALLVTCLRPLSCTYLGTWKNKQSTLSRFTSRQPHSVPTSAIFIPSWVERTWSKRVICVWYFITFASLICVPCKGRVSSYYYLSIILKRLTIAHHSLANSYLEYL